MLFKTARDFVAGGAQHVVLGVLSRTASASSNTHLRTYCRTHLRSHSR